MDRRVIVPRIILSAFIASGCSPQRDTEPRSVDVPVSAIETAAEAEPPPVATPPTPLEPEGEPRETVYALRRHVWIRTRPSTKAPWLGFLGLGGATPTRGPSVRGAGCDAFVPVEPRGFVCLDARSTLDEHHPSLAAIRAIAPRRGTPWPHHYAESRQAPRYETLPSPETQRRREFQLEAHLEAVEALRRGDFDGTIPKLLRDVDVTPAGVPAPAFLDAMPPVHEHRRTVRAGSTISYAQEFDAQGRTWIITGDGMLIPKDRVSPYPISRFEGMAIDEDNPLPVGFIKERPRAQYVMQSDGTIAARGVDWPRLASFGLTGREAEQDGEVYLQTRDSTWVRSADVTVVRASPETPWGDRIEAGGVAPNVRWGHARGVPPPGERRTWVEVSVHQGWLVAYEGARPVRATLVATGRGEPVEPGSRALQTSTPPGIFAIQGKYFTSTMAVNSTAHFDVPFAMPYSGAYALHAAYWHDRWGEKVSLGCVNLAPIDARWLFDWAEPSIPEGWQGMRATPELGNATVVVVHA